MKAFWFFILCSVTFVFQFPAQNKPDSAVLKWSIKRERFTELSSSLNGEVILIIRDRINILSFDWEWNERFKGEVEFIETKTGETISKFLVCGGRKFGLNSFSYDGNLWAVTCESGRVELWNIKQSKCLKEFYPIKAAQIDAVFLSPDGTRLLAIENSNSLTRSTNNHAVLWNTQTGKSIAELYPNLTIGDKGANSFPDFSSDSEMVAVSYNADVYLWNARNGKQIMRLISKKFGEQTGTHKSLTFTVRFSPDGKKIVTGSHDMLFKIWDTITGELEQTLKGHKSRDTTAAFNQNSELVATADWDNYVKLWKVGTGELLWTAKLKSWAFDLKFSPDGKKLLADMDTQLAIIDVKTGKILWSAKNWWQADRNLKWFLNYDKKNKQLRLFELS